MKNDKIYMKVADMNKEENVEMYYIEMVELYSKKYKINREDVFELFSNHFVFERIVSNEEFWGHFNYDENIEYIEDMLLSKTPNQILLYHGSVYSFNNIDLSKSQGNRDFGNGFYTTVMYKQAYDWSNALAKRFEVKPKFVYSYIYDLSFNKQLNVKEFTSTSEEWLDFILENRKSKSLIHNYDIVSGPVADDNVKLTLTLYENGELNKSEALTRLAYNKTSNQVSFHTKRAIDLLKLQDKEEFE